MFLAAFTSALQAKPQAVQTKRAWLSRDFASTCPHAEQRWLLNAGLTFSTRPRALFSSLRTSNPQPEARMPRFNPAFCLTFRPGASRVPRAERVMFWIFRVLHPDEVESPGQLGADLLNPVLAPVALAGFQPCDAKPHAHAAVRASPGAGKLAFQTTQSFPLPLGQSRYASAVPLSTGPQQQPRRDRRRRPCRYRVPESVRERRRKPHASVPPGPWSPDTTSRPAAPHETSREPPHPTLGTRTSPT